MALNTYGLGFELSAKDQASKVFEKIGGNLEHLEKQAEAAKKPFDRMAEAGAGIAKPVKKDAAAASISLQEASSQLASMGARVTGVSHAILDTLLGAADSASNFQAAIQKAGFFTDATAEEMVLLKNAAQNVDLALKGFSFEEQASTLQQLANEIGNTKDAIEELVPALNLAKITGMSGAAAAGFLADVVAGFGLEAKDAAGVVDKFAYSMKKFGLTANELEGAVMPAIGAAKLMGASFEDVLTVVGIANSGLGNVRKSAMAATMALNQLADPSTQAEFAGLGIQVKDSAGKFRSLMDIMGDVATKTEGMTDAQKAARLASVFSAKTAGGLNVVMDQLAKGVTDASGKLLKGAAAAAELKRQMEASAGTAEIAASAVKTFGEQKNALSAVMKSLMTAIGEPVQEVLAPIVAFVANVIARVTKAFLSLGPTFKRVVVGIVGVVGVFTGIVGSALAAAGAITGMILAGKALLIGLGAVAAGAIILVAAMAPLIAAGATLYLLWTRNIGGIADKVKAWFDKIKLAVTALQEVFSSGGFSMAVYKELDKAENSGIKAFAINAFLWFNRFKNFFVKLGDAFSAGVEKIGPVIERISQALGRIGARFGMTTDSADQNKSAFEKWGAVGARVGEFLAKIVEYVAIGFEKLVNFVDGAFEAFEPFRPMLTQVWTAAKDLGAAFLNLFSVLMGGNASGEMSVDTWKKIGEAVGWLAGQMVAGLVVAFRVVGGVVEWVAGIIGGLRALFDGLINGFMIGVKLIIAIFSGEWGQAWQLAQDFVVNWAATILKMLTSIVGGAAGMVDSLGKLFGKDLGLKAKVEGLGASAQTSIGAPPALPAPATSAGAAPGSPAAAQAAAGTANAAQVAGAVAAAGQSAKPVEVNTRTTLVVDGQVLTDVVTKGQQQNANRSFQPGSPATAT